MATEVKSLSETQLDLRPDAGTRRLQRGCCFALIVIAAARAWFTRYEIDPDSMSYLDLARAITTGNLGAAFHSFWSPGYPLLIAAFQLAFRPSPHWEFPLVHLINVLVFVGTLACFQLFWRETQEWHKRNVTVRDSEIPGMSFWALGYAAFGLVSLDVIRVGLVGPDLAISAFCYLAGWNLLRLRRVPTLGYALLLGCLLALGYCFKAPFFPMGIVFVLCAYLWRQTSRRILLLASTTLITFVLGCAPLVAALSVAKGRLTFGDSGRVNWAFYINDVQYFRHWQGGPPGSGVATHPTRRLSDFPEIYEFAANNMGTYPPWFDPSYWNEGITPHLNLRRQATVLARGLGLEFQIMLESGPELICGLIILLLCSSRRRWMRQVWQLWFLWAPGAVALMMYASIHVEPRYLGAWLAILFGGGVCACKLPVDRHARQVAGYVGTAVLLTAGAILVLQASREAVGIDHYKGRSPQNATIADFLLGNGLHSGDEVALIGDGTGAYWAHLARLHIVAEIPEGSASRPGHPALDFWLAGPELQRRALSTLKGTGARAVVASSVPAFPNTDWKRISDTGSYIYFFQ